MMNDYDVMIRKLMHYDTAYDYDMSMYDNLPYKRDREKCNESTISLSSGNVFSFYRCNYMSDEPYVCKAPDIVFSDDNSYSHEDKSSNNDSLDDLSTNNSNSTMPDSLEQLTEEQIDLLFQNADI